MSDSEEHHFESKADAGASKTYPQQAGTVRKNGYVVIKGRPFSSAVVEVSTSKTGKHGHAKCHFVAIDIFNGKKLEDIVPSSHNCDIPHVTRVEYQLIDVSEDGFVSLLTESGGTKDDLKLPTDDALNAHINSDVRHGRRTDLRCEGNSGQELGCFALGFYLQYVPASFEMRCIHELLSCCLLLWIPGWYTFELGRWCSSLRFTYGWSDTYAGLVG